MRDGESIRASDVRYLPIVSAFARTIGVVEEVDRLCGHKNGISPRRIVLALMVDALSGRTPLFRLPQAFAKLDTELLLGRSNFSLTSSTTMRWVGCWTVSLR